MYLKYAVFACFAAGFLHATPIYDHYTTQYGMIYDSSGLSDSTGSFSVSPGYGDEYAVVSAEIDPSKHNLVEAIATVGYHDSLIFLNQRNWTSGLLDITYYSDFKQLYGGPGGVGAIVQATGNLQPDYSFNGALATVTVPFQYGVPFSLDGTITVDAGGATGIGILQITSLSVQTNSPFLWSSSSGTLYPFTNGQFTPTPEPASLFLCLFGIFGFAILRCQFFSKRFGNYSHEMQ